MTSDALPADIAHSTRVERSRRLFAGARRADVLGVSSAVCSLVGLWGHRSAAWLLAWLGALVLLVAGRFLLQRGYTRGSTAETDPLGWEWRFSLMTAPIGLLWAALPLIALPMTPAQDLLVGFGLLVVLTGAVGSLGISAKAFYGFVLLPLASLFGLFVLRASLAEKALAGLLLVYLGYLVFEQRQAADRLIAAVGARLRNEALVRQLRVAEVAVKRSLAEQEQLFDLAAVGVLLMRDARIVRVNPHFAQMLGYAPSQLIGQPTSLLCWNHGGGASDRAARAALEHGIGASCDGDIELRRHDERPIWVHLSIRLIDAEDSSRGHLAVISDISDRRERDVAMQRLAHEDPLTGLPNRRLLQDRMQQAFVQAQRRGRLMAVLLVDLDGFKKINETYGHEVGDDVLICVAQRLSGCVRGSDTVSRLGGDEFVVLLNDPGRGEDAQIVAEKLIESISTPIRSGARTLFVSASVGICMFPRDAQDAETMLRRADAAMYRAKQAGRGAWRLHREASGSAS